jgi:GT2 family glycosyltransferase
MYRREIFEQIGGFDEVLTNSEEYEFNLRCLYNGFKIGYCDSNLAYYRRHNSQKSVTMKPEIRVTAADIAKKYSKTKDKDVKKFKNDSK